MERREEEGRGGKKRGEEGFERSIGGGSGRIGWENGLTLRAQCTSAYVVLQLLVLSCGSRFCSLVFLRI